MNFVGVFGKNNLLKNIKNKNVNIIKINPNNIANIKNIKFQIIIINNDLNKFKNLFEPIKSIIENTEYVIINSDLNIEVNVLKSFKKKIITYGLNQKATVTVSSITDENILIDLQREIETLNNKIVEPEEKIIETSGNTDVYESLINYIVETILKK